MDAAEDRVSDQQPDDIAMAMAIIETIFDQHGLVGLGQGVLNMSASKRALALAAAAFIEVDPECTTPRAARVKSEEFGREVRQQMKLLQTRYEQKGERLLRGRALTPGERSH